MKTYEEMMIDQAKELERFPTAYALGAKDFVNMMANQGLAHGADGYPDDEDLKKIVRLESGGFVKQEDAEAYENLCALQNQERKQYAAERDKLKTAVLETMQVKKYLTCPDGDTLVCKALGRSVEALENDEFFSRCYKDAKEEYYHCCV